MGPALPNGCRYGGTTPGAASIIARCAHAIDSMKILLVNKFAYVTGGADRVFLDLASGLRERGHDVTVLSTDASANEERRGYFVPPTVTAKTRDDMSLLAAARVARDALWNAQVYRATNDAIRAARPDILHAFKLYPQLSVAPIAAAAQAGIPVVQSALDYEFISANPLDEKGSAHDRAETRLAYRRLNELLHLVRRRWHTPRVGRFVTCSRFVAARYASKGLVARVAPNPVQAYAEAVGGWNEREGAVFAARLHESKGVRDVVRAAELLPETRFTIVGSGPLENEVVKAASRLPNLSHVGWLDLPGLRGLFASARVVLTPSRWQEPGALTSLEAMATGTPVVTYRSGGLTEYVEDAAAGLVVDSTPTALAAGVRAIESDSDDWERLSRNGIEASRTIHAPETYLSRYEEVYRELAPAASSNAPSRRP